MFIFPKPLYQSPKMYIGSIFDLFAISDCILLLSKVLL